MTRQYWTTHGIALLLREYESRGAAWCADRLRCHPRRVWRKASEMGIRTKAPRGRPFRCGADERRNDLRKKS